MLTRRRLMESLLPQLCPKIPQLAIPPTSNCNQTKQNFLISSSTIRRSKQITTSSILPSPKNYQIYLLLPLPAIYNKPISLLLPTLKQVHKLHSSWSSLIVPALQLGTLNSGNRSNCIHSLYQKRLDFPPADNARISEVFVLYPVPTLKIWPKSAVFPELKVDRFDYHFQLVAQVSKFQPLVVSTAYAQCRSRPTNAEQIKKF